MKFLQVEEIWKIEKECTEDEKKSASTMKRGTKRVREEQEAPIKGDSRK